MINQTVTIEVEHRLTTDSRYTSQSNIQLKEAPVQATVARFDFPRRHRDRNLLQRPIHDQHPFLSALKEAASSDVEFNHPYGLQAAARGVATSGLPNVNKKIAHVAMIKISSSKSIVVKA